MLICLISYLSGILICLILFAEKMQLRTAHYKCVGVTEQRTIIILRADFHLVQIQKRKLKNAYFALNSSQLSYHDNCAFLSREND